MAFSGTSYAHERLPSKMISTSDSFVCGGSTGVKVKNDTDHYFPGEKGIVAGPLSQLFSTLLNIC